MSTLILNVATIVVCTINLHIFALSTTMKLEDEIKQTKPFKSEYQKLMLNIAVTSSWFNANFTELLKPFEISQHQFNVLRILKGRHPESYCNQEIASRMIDKCSNSTRIVDKLLDKDLVERKVNLSDRRLVNVTISKKGLDLLNKMESSTIFSQLSNTNFDEAKAKQMNIWLDELRG